MRHLKVPLTVNYISDGNSIGEPLHELVDATERVICNDEPYYPQTVKPAHMEDIALTVNTHDELVEALEKAKQRIIQLADTVNTLSRKLKLGEKVRAEDFYDVIDKALTRAKRGQG